MKSLEFKTNHLADNVVTDSLALNVGVEVESVEEVPATSLHQISTCKTKQPSLCFLPKLNLLQALLCH